jgi:hypothetical protein
MAKAFCAPPTVGAPCKKGRSLMSGHEKPYLVVEATHDGKVLATTLVQGGAREAERVVEESKANDPFGWFAAYDHRPMTRSELAFLQH